jgi:hypothetical protein
VCLTLALAGAAAGAEAPAEVDAVGFGLYRYHPTGWNWGSTPVTTDFTAATVTDDGECTIAFRIPESALPGLAASARFGIATGVVANGPIVWLSEGQDLGGAEKTGTPDAPVFGQARLTAAELRRGSGALQVVLTFDTTPVLGSAWDLMGLIDADGDSTTGYRGAEWLIQNVRLGPGTSASSGLSVAWFEARPGILRPGEAAQVVAWVSNEGPDAVPEVGLELGLPKGIDADQPLSVEPYALAPGQSRRHVWVVRASRTGTLPLRLTVTGMGKRVQRVRDIAVVDRRDPRHEYVTQSGDWRPYPDRPTLQDGNAAGLHRIEALPPSALKSNLFGITTHLPRTTNDEDPYVAARAVDGDPKTCWASRWWRIATPFEPEWLRVDLGRIVRVAEVRFLPAWADSGVPASFTIETSLDGETWKTVATRDVYRLQSQAEGSSLREDGRNWQCFPFASRRARFVRLTATRLAQGATSFFCAPFDPFQFRVAEVAAVDPAGVLVPPVAATASTTHTAWYNTPESVTKTWPLLLTCGVKLNRIGQWGDRTDWAAVEQVKGVYRVPAEVDRAIEESQRAGVETLLTLAYGNNLYQRQKVQPDAGPTWQRGHPFLQCAPTTDEAVEAFARYCGYMARHFRGRVRYFEIWNEENGWFFDDWGRSAEVSLVRAYGRALKLAAQAVKEANPEAIVVFGGTAGSTFDYPRIALEEGAGPYIDVFAFHPYGHPTPEGVPDNFLVCTGEAMEWKPRPASVRDYEEEIAALREVLHRYNPSMQVWADEMNWFAPGEPARPDMGDLSELTQAKHLSRFYALNAWLGCGAVWWSMYNANGVQEWAVARSADYTPRPAWYAAQYASTVLDDVRQADGVTVEVVGAAPADLMVKAFRNGRGELLVGLWRTSPGSDGCKPEPVTVQVTGASADGAEALDLLYGVAQRARADRGPSGVTIPGLLVGDWPLVVRLR